MNIETFIVNFEESIEGLEAGTVRPETVMRDLPQWDSLAVLTTLAMIDAEYEVSITANELADQRTVQNLFDLVAQKAET
ncbi:MAG: phosphopantetheine-binding protein [Opitutales bacterium]